MNSSAHPSIFSKLLGLFGPAHKSETEDNLEHAGDRDGALTMSEEPTGEEVERVASEKTGPRKGKP